MRFLYISVLASRKVIDEVRQRDSQFSSYAVQKFSRLLAEGLFCNKSKVSVLSTFFHPSIVFFWHHKKEREQGIDYKYIPSPNYAHLRHLWIIIYCFFYVLSWGLGHKKEKVVLCDVLNVSACIGTVAAARLIGLRRVGIMTDMPGLMVSRSKKTNSGKRGSLNTRINKSFLKHFTHYVFLTEKMNEAVNTYKRPYIVMEGLVDANINSSEIRTKEQKRVVLYAGGLHERYGLKMLVEGFIAADVDNSELWLYGDGPFVNELQSYMQFNSRIRYFGIRPNQEVVKAELGATLLVNPRPTHETFTQYSFPSKNMEYMVSGTPVLTTALPGMPKNYYPYVYLFDQGETKEGYAIVLRKILSLPDVELRKKGLMARQWVLDNKNNISQTERIIRMVTD